MALHRQRSQTETKNPSRGQSIANLENSRQVTSLRLNLNILTAQKKVEGVFGGRGFRESLHATNFGKRKPA